MNVKRKVNFCKIAALAAISILVAGWFYRSFNRLQENARESELRGLLKEAADAEQAYYREYRTYDEDLSAVGFAPDGKAKVKLSFGKKPSEGNGRS